MFLLDFSTCLTYGDYYCPHYYPQNKILGKKLHVSQVAGRSGIQAPWSESQLLILLPA